MSQLEPEEMGCRGVGAGSPDGRKCTVKAGGGRAQRVAAAVWGSGGSSGGGAVLPKAGVLAG